MGRLKKNYKRVENTSNIKLTNQEKELIYYLLDERLTPSQIANIRHTSLQNEYKKIKKLKDKGIIKEVEKNSFFKGGSYSETTKGDNNYDYRLHAESFTISVLNAKDFYYNYIKKKNRDTLDNNTIFLYEDKIVVYSNKDFWGRNVNECVRLSLDYWGRFITKLENNYKIDLIKPKNFNIKFFRCEIARVGDLVAKKFNLEKNLVKIYVGGQLRLIVDKSFKFDELEAVHKEHSISDMQYLESELEDKISNKDFLLLPSELQKLVQTQQKQLKDQIELNNQNIVMMRALMQEIKDLKSN